MRLKSGLCHLAAAVTLCCALPAAGRAAVQSGSWSGVYRCAQGLTGAHLTLVVAPDGTAEGLFEFYAITQNPGVPRGCFEMSGHLDQAGHLALAPGAWRLQPPGYVAIGLTGAEDGADRLVGEVQGPGCSVFALVPVAPGLPASTPSACQGAIS
ncbi:hypothetical protein [Acidisoma sp. 7E03]